MTILKLVQKEEGKTLIVQVWLNEKALHKSVTVLWINILDDEDDDFLLQH